MDEHPETNFPVFSFRDSINKKLRPSPATTIILDNGNEGIKQKEERHRIQNRFTIQINHWEKKDGCQHHMW